MVKKLYKHELIAYARMLLPFEAVLLGIALLTRFVQFFETDSIPYNLIFTSSVIMLVIASIVCIVLTLIAGVTRFYRNLFTSEGYLSFTLPVTPTAHILVKLTTATLFSVVTFFVVLAAIGIATAGEVFTELCRALSYLLHLLFQNVGTLHSSLYILELVLLLLMSAACEYLLFYACISIGQLARKNRILTAVGVYFAYYMITQVLSTILMILLTVLHDHLPIEQLLRFAGNHPHATGHIVLCFLLLSSLIMAGIYYLIVHHIIHKKLNLE